MYQWQLLPEDAGTISGADHVGTVEWNLSFLGTASVSVKSINECGESEFSENLDVMVYNTVGYGKVNENITGLQIIPNPSSGKFRLEIESKKEISCYLSIMSSTGSTVYSEDDLSINKKLTKEMELGHLNAGVYYLNLGNDDFRIVRKLIIKN
jgi:hypothetical protein